MSAEGTMKLEKEIDEIAFELPKKILRDFAEIGIDQLIRSQVRDESLLHKIWNDGWTKASILFHDALDEKIKSLPVARQQKYLESSNQYVCSEIHEPVRLIYAEFQNQVMSEMEKNGKKEVVKNSDQASTSKAAAPLNIFVKKQKEKIDEVIGSMQKSKTIETTLNTKWESVFDKAEFYGRSTSWMDGTKQDLLQTIKAETVDKITLAQQIQHLVGKQLIEDLEIYLEHKFNTCFDPVCDAISQRNNEKYEELSEWVKTVSKKRRRSTDFWKK